MVDTEKIIKERLETFTNSLDFKPKIQMLKDLEYVVLRDFKIPQENVHITWNFNNITDLGHWEVNVKIIS